MLFQEILGHEDVKSQLRKIVRSQRIPHSLLFLGRRGSGDLALAIAFAQYLLCKNREEHEACGECSNCLKASKLIHPDIHFVFPTIGGKATSDEFSKEWRAAILENPYFNVFQWLEKIGGEGKQGNITAQECLRIVQRLSLKSMEAEDKVLILWLPEYLGKEGNRLLKLIEEPPENTQFILVAEDQDQILNTILSRCQIIKIQALPDEIIAEGLQKKLGISDNRASSIAYLADGDFNEALNIANLPEDSSQGRSRLFLEWLRKCYVGNGVEMAAWVEGFATAGRENQKFFLQYGLHFFREFLQLKMEGNSKLRLLQDEIATAEKMTKVIEFQQVSEISRLFSDCSYYVERNANPKLLFMDASIRLNKILKMRS